MYKTESCQPFWCHWNHYGNFIFESPLRKYGNLIQITEKGPDFGSMLWLHVFVSPTLILSADPGRTSTPSFPTPCALALSLVKPFGVGQHGSPFIAKCATITLFSTVRYYFL